MQLSPGQSSLLGQVWWLFELIMVIPATNAIQNVLSTHPEELTEDNNVPTTAKPSNDVAYPQRKNIRLQPVPPSMPSEAL